MTHPPLTFKQAAERLNVPESWLREKVAKRQIPHTRLGKHVRFTEDDLEEILRAARQPAIPAGRQP
ncbi:helix-turn-helix domain-containing protein [Nonomuraea sp. NPDC050556]|uniref:helix-turn-helix domain-containing protein n=1 Tax=Nonomuraea sp. NPDC050556 TaxID=3364369 RepID=UPI00378CCD2D